MSVFRAAAPRLSSLCSSSSRAPSFDDDVAAVRSRSNPRRRLFLCLISSRMVWHRLPTYLPSFPLRLVPLSQAQRAAYDATGFVKDLVFKTVPRVGKVRDRRKKEEKTSVRRLPRSFVVRPPPSLTLSLSLSLLSPCTTTATTSPARTQGVPDQGLRLRHRHPPHVGAGGEEETGKGRQRVCEAGHQKGLRVPQASLFSVERSLCVFRLYILLLY